MGRKKTGALPVSAPKKDKSKTIDMTKAELAKAYLTPGFRSGKHMTEKDRPRKKSWKKDYEKSGGESERYYHNGSRFFFSHFFTFCHFVSFFFTQRPL